MEYKRTEVVKIDVAVEEEEDNTIRCINCKKELNEKPWISVRCDEDIVHACKYGCAQRLKYYIGTGYWDRVINKEDFRDFCKFISQTHDEFIRAEDEED